MKIYFIKHVLSFPPDGPIDSFHYHMFHGVTKRPIGPHDGRTTTVLFLNRYGTPKILQPDIFFVVSARLSHRLGSIPQIKLLPVEPIYQFYKPYAKGDKSYTSDLDFTETEDWPVDFILKHERPECRAKDLQFFEVITPFNNMVSKMFRNLTRIEVNVDEIYGEDKLECLVSPAMLKEYPLQTCANGAQMMTERVYGILAGHIDRIYFHVVETELS